MSHVATAFPVTRPASHRKSQTCFGRKGCSDMPQNQANHETSYLLNYFSCLPYHFVPADSALPARKPNSYRTTASTTVTPAYLGKTWLLSRGPGPATMTSIGKKHLIAEDRGLGGASYFTICTCTHSYCSRLPSPCPSSYDCTTHCQLRSSLVSHWLDGEA